jgi:hypothetical protein
MSDEKIRRSQQEVMKALRRVGPCDDTTLVNEMQSNERYGWQSESGIRTRRKELERQGMVVDTGVRVALDSGRMARVWDLTTRHRNH